MAADCSSAYRILGTAVLLLGVLMAAGCSSRTVAPAGDAVYGPFPENAITATARSQLGAPYKYGGHSPETGFDCSGLVYWTFGQHDIQVPRTTRTLLSMGQQISRSQLSPGDLVFFRISGKTLHVGIWLGNGAFIHAPKTGAYVRIERLAVGWWSRRFIGARRV